MLIKVRVFPGSKEARVEKKGERWEVRVREEARENKANRAAIECLRDYFRVGPGMVRLVKGRRERNKIFEIKGNPKLSQ